MAERAGWGYPASNTAYAERATTGGVDGSYGLSTKTDDGPSICHSGMDMTIYGTNAGLRKEMDDRVQASKSQISTGLSHTMDARDSTTVRCNGVTQQADREHHPHTRRAVAR